MAHVLIPTDFSECSLNAAVHAVRLFGAGEGEFTLLNCYGLPEGVASELADTQPLLARAAEEGLRRFEEILRQRSGSVELKISCVTEQGDLTRAVVRFSGDMVPPVMVVMGTQGSAASIEVFFGSNTASVIKHCGLPVLAVPAQAGYRSPKRLLLADDGGPVDKQTLRPLIDIARRAQGEISVVRVVNERSGDDVSGLAQVYDALLGAIPHTQHVVSGENVEAALNELADQGDADLLAVLHRDRSIFQGLFHRSMAARLAMHTHLPLLVLQQRMN